MIQRLTVISMFFAMLTHTLLGCGWHHAHDCHAGNLNSCQTVAICEHSEHAHHDHAHHNHSDDSAHVSDAITTVDMTTEDFPVSPDTDLCQEGRCSYLTSTSVKLHEVTTQLVNLLPPLNFLFSSQEKQYILTMLKTSTLRSGSAPGVCAQIQTSVWLI